MAGQSSLYICCLYAFAFIFTPHPLTKQGLVAQFHVKQADTITLMDCLLFLMEKIVVWYLVFLSFKVNSIVLNVCLYFKHKVFFILIGKFFN